MTPPRVIGVESLSSVLLAWSQNGQPRTTMPQLTAPPFQVFVRASIRVPRRFLCSCLASSLMFLVCVFVCACAHRPYVWRVCMFISGRYTCASGFYLSSGDASRTCDSSSGAYVSCFLVLYACMDRVDA